MRSRLWWLQCLLHRDSEREAPKVEADCALPAGGVSAADVHRPNLAVPCLPGLEPGHAGREEYTEATTSSLRGGWGHGETVPGTAEPVRATGGRNLVVG